MLYYCTRDKTTTQKASEIPVVVLYKNFSGPTHNNVDHTNKKLHKRSI